MIIKTLFIFFLLAKEGWSAFAKIEKLNFIV